MPEEDDRTVMERVDLHSLPRGRLTSISMRQVFFLLLALVILRAFFPTVGVRLEAALLAFLDLAGRVFSSAGFLGGSPLS